MLKKAVEIGFLQPFVELCQPNFLYKKTLLCYTKIVKALFNIKRKGVNIMPDYKKMYLELLNQVEEVIEKLKAAEQACEDIYVRTYEDDESEDDSQ